ncbi:MAG: hypothetical protein Q9P01_14875 [Anaerolineae bacterium]|nr:hypothetical protein [Anaerolineae bacterium]
MAVDWKIPPPPLLSSTIVIGTPATLYCQQTIHIMIEGDIFREWRQAAY